MNICQMISPTPSHSILQSQTLNSIKVTGKSRCLNSLVSPSTNPIPWYHRFNSESSAMIPIWNFNQKAHKEMDNRIIIAPCTDVILPN